METYLVQHYVDEQVQRNPGKIAVTDGSDAFTYGDLAGFSNRLARCLTRHGVSRQDAVVFCLRRSANCLTAILGILKADAIYVPIDHKSPVQRWEKILEDCRPSALICDEFTLSHIPKSLLDAGDRFPIVCLAPRESVRGDLPANTVCREQVNEYESRETGYQNRDTDIAYVLYTSGSTGSPKGVMISHRNIKSYIDWAIEDLGLGEDDRILGTAPFYFDMSTFDIYCSMKAGATLCIATDGLMLFPEKLVSFIEREKVTVWKGISSLLMYMARSGAIQQDRMPTLRKILFGGETLPTKYLIQWMQAYPDKRFYNVYGPTEATGISLYHCINGVPEDYQEKIPIGRPCRGTTVLLLNEDNTPTKTGDVGELCIGGPGLSPGYLNDRSKTEQAFIRNPENPERIYRSGDLVRLRNDGHYEFVSRKDGQVKFMGYRIELSEIEHALISSKEVRDAAVLLLESEHRGLNELVAFYEPENGAASLDIISHLKQRLPHYMMPKKLVPMERIPRCDRGKVSREALRSYYANLNQGQSC